MLKQKKVPLRTCIVTKEILPKNKLVRIVKTDTDIKLDFTGKLNGRGAYIKDSEDVFNNLIKSKALNRAFKENIKLEVYEQIINEYKSYKEN